MRKPHFYILALIFISLFVSCNGSGDNPGLLPTAKGEPAEIVLVADSVVWAGPVGDELRKLLMESAPGLPRKESLYWVHYVQPEKLNGLLKQSKNLIFVTTLDRKTQMSQYFTRDALNQIKKDTTLFMDRSENHYARGQEVLYLFSATSDLLLSHIKENAQVISNYFNRIENVRKLDALKSAPKDDQITSVLEKDLGVSMMLPTGYQIAKKTNDFIWLRHVEQEIDKDIFIARKPYSDVSMFEVDSIIAWKNEIGKKHIYGDPDQPESYVIAETANASTDARQVTLNGNFAIETRGLWKTYYASMGGPYISYTVSDEKTGYIYYIEGFLYSPSKSQRELMRELQVSLQTFKVL